MPAPWKRCRGVSVRHDAEHVSLPTGGTGHHPGRINLIIGVSIVTHTSEGIGQYAVPGVRLRMMKDDVGRMTEDEAIY